MRTMNRKQWMRRALAAAPLVALGAAAAAASAQEPATGQEPPPAPPEQEPSGQEEEPDDGSLEDMNPFRPPAGQAELQELFLRVEKRLKRVTDLLYEASSGDMSRADEVGGAGIDELIRGAEQNAAGASSGIARMLEATRGQSEATLDDIERILQLAEQQQQQGSGGGGQGQPQPGQGQEMPQQGQTPSGSRKEETGASPPRPGGEQPGDPQPEGDEPRGNQEQSGGPDGPAEKPPGNETGDPSQASGGEEWGDLPIHLRKVFQNGVSDEVPPRYRDWVDSYYQRLNKRSNR